MTKDRHRRPGPPPRPRQAPPEAGKPAAAPRAPAPPPAAALPGLPLLHPATLLVALVTAVILVLSVTYDLYDPDQWQHLTVGRYIWEQHRFPTTELWTWPTYGQKTVDYAWGFEALVWPFWKLGGLTGLYLWRWLTTLAAFGFGWAAARRMGAKGLAPLVVIALCAMIHRGRSWVRPETVALILLAAEIWLLESRRHGHRIHAAWLVPIAWIWANTHISYYLFFMVLGIHALAALLPPRREGAPPARELWLAGVAAAAISFVNPSGWRTLWQPFEFFLVWRHEPIYQNIYEMMPVDWTLHLTDGLPVVLLLWPVLALLRARRAGFDRVEALTCLAFSATVLVGQRFIGVYSLVAAVYLGRDLDEWLRAARRPAWAAAAGTRAALAAAACLLVALPDLARSDYGIRMVFPAYRFPTAACDYIERQGLRGRMFNPYDYGGYVCFRFWPDRQRLPFMGIHQEGSKELRALYVAAQADPASTWPVLDGQCRFDMLLMRSSPVSGENLLAVLDRDTTWARVFGDDAACLYVRRAGPFARLAADSAYAVLPADPASLDALRPALVRDSTLRRRVVRELWRAVAASPWHAQALIQLANASAIEGRWAEAGGLIERAIWIEPELPFARELLGMIALRLGRPREALRWFAEERRFAVRPGVPDVHRGMDFRRAQVAQAEGDLRRARDLYRRHLGRHANDQEARDSLDAVSRRLGE